MLNDRAWKFSELHYNTFIMIILSLHKVLGHPVSIWGFMKAVINYKQVFFRRQRATITQVVHCENCQILANNSHIRDTMHSLSLWLLMYSWPLDSLWWTDTFWKLIKIDKSAVSNKWTKLSPCGNLFISIVRMWAETNQLANDSHRRTTK